MGSEQHPYHIRTLTREEINRVIEGKGRAGRIPLLYDLWINSSAFQGNEEAYRKWQSQYPCDVDGVFLNMPGLTEGPKEDPDFFWAPFGAVRQSKKGLDAQCVLKDWDNAEEVEAFFNTFPDPESPALIPCGKERDGRYLLGRWWYCYFERLWSLRGMENALMDFYLYPDKVHRLFSRLTDFYMRCMERAKEAWDVDGFFVSDDIGTQTGPFFSMDIFREFFKPYYRQLIDKAHTLGTHFWLHCCGNIQIFLPEFIEIGLDVIHPIQKYTMKEEEIAKEYGDKICIFAGFDVQHLMAFGTPEEVKAEVNYLMKTYDRPEGRLMMTMGNGATPDWKIENLDALYEASIEYDSHSGKNEM